MKKNFKYYAAIWALLFVLFQVVAFSVGIIHRANFWIAYLFLVITMIGQLGCTYFLLKSEKPEKIFLNISVLRVSILGMIVSMAVAVICMAVTAIPTALCVVVNCAVFVFAVIAVLKANVAAETVGKLDDKIKKQTFFIKSLTVDAEDLAASAKKQEAKEVCKKVYEAVRYSDPMNNEALASAESEITVKFQQFSKAVAANSNDIEAIAEELILLLEDRNKKCRMLK